jgi:hypothetical protein
MNEDLTEFINPNSCRDAINEPARCGGSPRLATGVASLLLTLNSFQLWE